MATSVFRSGLLLMLLLARSGEGGRPPSAVREGPRAPVRSLSEGVVRVVNASRYELIDLRLNNAQRLQNGQTLNIGSSTEFSIEPGPLEYSFGAGFWSGLSRNVWFGSAGRTLVAPGQTVTVTISNPTLEQVLTDFGASADWEGVFFDARGALHRRRIHVTAAGLFTLATDGAIERTGFVELVEWPDKAPTVTFRFCDPDCGPDLQIAHPFKRFDSLGGPSAWPLIEYFRQ